MEVLLGILTFVSSRLLGRGPGSAVSSLINNYGGYMPLHQAVLQSNFQAVRQLVEAGADVDAQNCNRLTPLQCCKAPGDIAGKVSVIFKTKTGRY